MKNISLLILTMLLFHSCNNTSDSRNIFNSKPHKLQTNIIVKDPISLINTNGYYHLFYISGDYNDDARGKNVSHASSKDLVTWEKLPHINPLNRNVFNYKGGFVFDTLNRSGFGTKEQPPIVGLFVPELNEDKLSSRAGNENTPIIITSNDNCVTWNLYTDESLFPEPFINNPQKINVFWQNMTNRWIMSLIVSDHIEFYSSPDMRHWYLESYFGNNFFPEGIKIRNATLFQLSNEIHWVLFIDFFLDYNNKQSANTLYMIGNFDGHLFRNLSSTQHILDYGENIMGSIELTNKDYRRLILLWENNAIEFMPTQKKTKNCISFLIRQIDLDNLNEEFAIQSSPIKEWRDYYKKTIEYHNLNISERSYENGMKIKIPAEIELVFNTSDVKKWFFPSRIGAIIKTKKGEEISFGYDTSFQRYFLNTSELKSEKLNGVQNNLVKMPFTHLDSTLSMKLIIKNSSIEFYAEEGKLVSTDFYLSENPMSLLIPFSENGIAELISMTILN